jgi:ADP-ribose pyrophosphatase
MMTEYPFRVILTILADPEYTEGMIDVAAAVIENREGRILIARRKAEISLGGYWEFPGGRIEEGETAAVCVARELHEEMDVRIEAGDVLAETVHDYGTKVIHLIAVRAILLGGHIRLHDHDDIRWVTVTEMGDYLFAPADEAIVEKLQEKVPAHSPH